MHVHDFSHVNILTGGSVTVLLYLESNACIDTCGTGA